MYLSKIILFFSILFFLFSCTKKEVQKSVIKEKNLNMQVLEAYKEGMTSLDEGDVLYAAKKFNEAEMLFPQSEWAPKSALMAAYSYYVQDYYGDAILELERFIKLYSKYKNLDYAYYLLAICYYEQIVDETKDTKSIFQAKKYFTIIIDDFPNTDYAMDSKFKLDLISDTLAAKEMYWGRYYFDREKWIPAINRFQAVINEYDTTIYAEEAMHRLVEIYYTLGLLDESKKYASLLGYNYQSSIWYEKTYTIYNKKYELNKINKKKKNKKQKIIIKKFKTLFEWNG